MTYYGQFFFWQKWSAIYFNGRIYANTTIVLFRHYRPVAQGKSMVFLSKFNSLLRPVNVIASSKAGYEYNKHVIYLNTHNAYQLV